jgi:hypothetical protein
VASMVRELFRVRIHRPEPFLERAGRGGFGDLLGGVADGMRPSIRARSFSRNARSCSAVGRATR